jgi:hypothetical protein
LREHQFAAGIGVVVAVMMRPPFAVDRWLTGIVMRRARSLLTSLSSPELLTKIYAASHDAAVMASP